MWGILLVHIRTAFLEGAVDRNTTTLLEGAIDRDITVQVPYFT